MRLRLTALISVLLALGAGDLLDVGEHVFQGAVVLQQLRGCLDADPGHAGYVIDRVADEGLEFDWEGRRVTFDKGGEKRAEPITGESVDWLSMIFQLAAAPPKGDAFDLQVFTQRKLYNFHLRSLGVEEIVVPIGRVRARHLQHVDRESGEVVDVWVGLDQHNLPVKLRFPVARNRVMVEQVATDITER